MLLGEFDVSSLVTAGTPLPISLLVFAVWHFKKRADSLEERINELQQQVTKFTGVMVALRQCPINECKLKDLKPELVV